MALIKCPQCGHDVSPKATACPSCGHPIAAPTSKAAQTGCGSGCAIFGLLAIGFVAWAAIEGGRLQDEEAKNPTCVSDYKKCADNAELVKKHQSKDHISMSVICKVAAEKVAKYGSPELPMLSFQTYYVGRNYIDSGIATLLEKDAMYQNGFGAKEHVTARCEYSLDDDVAIVTLSER